MISGTIQDSKTDKILGCEKPEILMILIWMFLQRGRSLTPVKACSALFATEKRQIKGR